jgi:uncharacterized OB-fold protein
MKLHIDCTIINVISKGVLEIECPSCGEIFQALPSCYTPEDYFCHACKSKVTIEFVAVSKLSEILNRMDGKEGK